MDRIYQITRQYHFSAAHMLPDHNGKCARLHGHNYKLEVFLDSAELLKSGSSEGMVMDFGDVDTWVQPLITMMDHRMLVKGDEWPYLAWQEYHGRPMETESSFYVVGVRTTAENLAEYIGGRLRPWLHQLSGVRLWETDRSAAAWWVSGD